MKERTFGFDNYTFKNILKLRWKLEPQENMTFKWPFPTFLVKPLAHAQPVAKSLGDFWTSDLVRLDLPAQEVQ